MPLWRTNKRKFCAFPLDSTGFFSLEALLVLPIFLGFCAVLLWGLEVARVQAVLQEAVDEAVSVTASVAYGLTVVDHIALPAPLAEGLAQWEALVPLFGTTLQEKITDAVEQAVTHVAVHQRWVIPFVSRFLDKGEAGKPQLHPKRMRLTHITLPIPTQGQYMFGLTLQYTLPVPIPFFSKRTVVLTATAIERCWVGVR